MRVASSTGPLGLTRELVTHKFHHEQAVAYRAARGLYAASGAYVAIPNPKNIALWDTFAAKMEGAGVTE